MRSTFQWILLAVVFATSLSLRAGEALPKAPAYELHEWGVFCAPRNAAWSNLDMRGEWDTFPKFFYRVWPQQYLPYFGPVKKPVIYIHTPQPFMLDLKIKFAEGRPLVWWPAAQRPAAGIGEAPGDTLTFNMRVGSVAPPGSWQATNLEQMKLRGEQPAGRRLTEQDPPTVEKGHWVETLRTVNAAKLYTEAGYTRNGDDPESVDTFLYYDGLMKAPATPTLTRTADGVQLESNSSFELLDVFAVERTEKGLRVSNDWKQVASGPQKTTLVMSAPVIGKEEEALIEKSCAELITRLKAAGLNDAEASSMVKVWTPGFFKNLGLTVFYRIPQTQYDAWLPLEAKPAPAKTVRVGMVVHYHLEPELEATVSAQIKLLAAENFDTRDQAKKALIAIGGAAFPQLEAALKSDDPETREGAAAILKTLDVRPALDPKQYVPRWRGGGERE